MPFHFGLRNVGALGGAYSAGFVPISATGGDTVTDIVVGNRDYRVHTFTTAGSSSFVVTDSGTDGEVEYLIVGGGGYGGYARGGGGGAGGFREGATTITSSTYSVLVGAGMVTFGSSTPSSALGIEAASGGEGAAGPGFISVGAGGSGGGGAGHSGHTAGGAGNTPAVSPSQGNNGGTGFAGGGGGGGGGAGGVGGNGTSGAGGSKGAGKSSSITGVSVTYAEGGGGATNTVQGVGGGVSSGMTPAANTGGGGGANVGTAATGGNGASGVVIIRYPLEAA